MTGFLLDTNVLSEFSRRGEPDARVKRWLTQTEDRFLFTSVLALAETRQGIELCEPGKRRAALEEWLEQDLRRSFETRLLPVTQAVADRWAVLSARMQQRGTPPATIDGLIGATALEHGLTVTTRNVKDFAGLGIEIFNPWESETAEQ
jgi:predicted nucleic acid-binding protein